MSVNILLDRINSDLDGIVNDVKNLLYDGKYSEVQDTLQSIFALAERTYNIKLDEKEKYDHVFQELYEKLKEEIDNKTGAMSSYSADYIALLKYFNIISDKILKTAEVRKKVAETKETREEIIEDYKAGIEEAKENIKIYSKEKERSEKIKVDIFGSDDPNLKDKIYTSKFNYGKLEDIKNLFQKIADSEDAINTLRGSGHPKEKELIDNLMLQIESFKRTIDTIINEMEKNGLNVSSIKNVAEVMPRTAGQANVEALQNDVNKELEAYYTQVADNIKSAKVKYKDVMFFKRIDVTKFDPTTEEGRKAIENAMEAYVEYDKSINDALKEQEARIAVWTDEIEQIEREQEVLKVDITDDGAFRNGMSDEVKAKIEQEKAKVREENEDMFYGNDEKAKKYDECLKKLKEHEEEVDFTYKKSDGTEVTLKYKTIRDADTPEMRELFKFMNLESYKDRLERTTKCQAVAEVAGIDEAKKVYIGLLMQDQNFKNYVELESMKSGRSRKDILEDFIANNINNQIMKDMEYLRNI